MSNGIPKNNGTDESSGENFIEKTRRNMASRRKVPRPPRFDPTIIFDKSRSKVSSSSHRAGSPPFKGKTAAAGGARSTAAIAEQRVAHPQPQQQHPPRDLVPTPVSESTSEVDAKEGKAPMMSEEVCQSIKKGMRIINDMEQTRADGIKFKVELDLMYALAGEKATARAPPGLCVANCQRAACEKTEEPTGQAFCCCSRCGAKYCSRDCQVIDWKICHKAMCGQLRKMRSAGPGGGRAPLDRQGVVARVLGRVRLYLCPFAVCHGEALGRGFIFVQTPNPMLELEYLRPVNSNGRRLDRSIILHFLSMGEFVESVLREDFELGVIRDPLNAAVETYDTKSEVVVLFRARCGYMAVAVVPLVPELAVCRQLGREYQEKEALQLNLD